jgi:DnaJ-class molecular chaperone
MNKGVLMLNHYEILSVTTDAPFSVIQSVYNAILKKHSPENYEGEKKMQAEKAIKKLTTAYEILSDKTKRKIYDESIGVK